MSERNSRHPLKNFFINKPFQFRMLYKVFLVVVLTGLVTVGLFTFFYNMKSRSGSFYYMPNDVMRDLELQSIVGVVLPPVLAVEVVAIIIAFGIGLFSSRKVAVPLYKIEKWATRLRNGKLNTRLAFREEDHLKDLATECNEATEFYRLLLSEIKTHTDNISSQPADQGSVLKNVTALKQILNRVEL